MRKTLFATAIMLLCSLAAMAISPSWQGEKAMSPFKLKAEPPHQLSRQSNMIFFKDFTPEAEKERLAQNGISLTRSFNGIPYNTGHIIPAKVPMKEEESCYTVTINLKYDKEEVESVEYGMALSNYDGGNSYFNEWTGESTPDNINFIIPSGNYDFQVLFETVNTNFIILTAVNVEVDKDLEISLDTADATVEITWNALMPDGTNPYPETPILAPTTYELLGYEPGNAIIVSNSLSISNIKHDTGATIGLSPWTTIVGDTRYIMGEGNIKTTPNNDYVFQFQKEVIAKNGGYIIALIAHADQSAVVTNNVKDFITIKPEFIYTPHQPTPEIIGDDDEDDDEDEDLLTEDPVIYEFENDKTFCLNYATIQNGIMNGSSTLSFCGGGDEIQKWIHVCQSPEQLSEYQVMPIPALLQDWDLDYYTATLPINITPDSSKVLAINNTRDFSSYLTCPDDRNIYMSRSVNPTLSFDLSTPHVWNYGCPTLVFSTDSDWGKSFRYAYIGRLGENRSIDLLSTKATVSVNGFPPSDEVLEDLQWGDLPEEGKIDFEFTDTNVAIDDIVGKNVTRIGFDMARTDWQPPTLQIVRFVDKEDNFTDRYATGEDGVIEFYGGDFIYHKNSETHADWYTEEPAAEVKVEYAPYGTDSFLPLEIENVAERDFMPGFGTYYRGSLGSVDRKSENGWFDVRITLTDAAGNFQEQTLSPAFKIDSTVGVETLVAPEIAVTVANGVITVCGCENPVIEIYTPTGTLIARSKGTTIDSTNLNHGVYLVNVTDSDKRVVRKVRI